MPKYTFDWTIRGETVIEAEDAAEAQRKFERLSKIDLTFDGDLEDVDEPKLRAEPQKVTAE